MSRALLRVATAGSVDDGKSTLLGRLLYDAGALSSDTVAAVRRASGRRGDRAMNLALVTDGLRAEREQGITIDVAYRFFATPHRSFIVADTPGHEQYTRNMVTGASTADVAIVLVDARNGMVRQSQRHLAIAALLGVSHIVVAVNKMDLVGWDEEVFRTVAKDAANFAAGLPWPSEITALPLSALHGDNVTAPSTRHRWFDGPALLPLLESLDPTVSTGDGPAGGGARLTVQWVIPPDATAGREARLLAGRVEGGALHAGQAITVMPSRATTTLRAIERYGRPVEDATAGQAVAVELDKDLDAGRGHLLVAGSTGELTVTNTIEADVCWMGEQPIAAGHRVALTHASRTVRAVVEAITGRVDITDGTLDSRRHTLELNDIGPMTLRLSRPLAVEPYQRHLSTGRFLVIDEHTNATVGAAMIRRTS